MENGFAIFRIIILYEFILTLTNSKKKYVNSFVRSITGSSVEILSAETEELIFNSLANTGDIIDSDKYNIESQVNIYNYQIPWIDKSISLITSSNSQIKKNTVWPDKRTFALCLTHDVDFVSSVEHTKKLYRRLRRLFCSEGPKSVPFQMSLGSVYRLITSGGRSDSLANFNRWIDLESRYGFKSTFNFFSFPSRNESVYDCDYKLTDIVIFRNKSMTVSNMIKAIDDSGWEIGLHGSYNSYRDSALLNEQKQSLENIINKKIVSTRNHYLQYDSSLTPKLQADIGLENDSTIGYNNKIGFLSGTSFPYWCWDIKSEQSLPLLEIPMSIMDVTLFSKCVSCVDFNNAILSCIKLMNEVQNVGGCLTLNWHPNYFNNDNYWQAYVILLQEASKRNAWGCTAGELSDWWNHRECLIMNESYLKAE